MRALHQFVAGYAHGDAISNEARFIRDIIRSWGLSSDIVSEAKRILPELRKDAVDLESFAATCQPDDGVLLHLSIGSPVNEVFRELNCRKAILYHNVTPPKYYASIQPQTAQALRRGLEQVNQLAGCAEVVMADSGFNAEELLKLGYGEVSVLPLVLDFDKLRKGVDSRLLKEYEEGPNILFVGRMAANKCIEDLFSAFYFYQKHICPEARFIHAGSFAGTERYQALLFAYLRELGIDQVDLLGAVRQDQLNALYRSADLFLCMSEHEGFCIPVIEAMAMDVPVLAYDAAAVPETMNGAGVLFDRKDFASIAEMMDKLIQPGPMREAVLQAQRARIQRYESRDLEAELKSLLTPLLASPQA